MSRFHQSAERVDVVLGAVVYLSGFGLHILVSDEHRAYLLIAVLGKLIEECLCGVDTFVECSHYLEFIVHEEVYIFFHALLVYHALGVILVV